MKEHAKNLLKGVITLNITDFLSLAAYTIPFLIVTFRG